MPLKELLIKGSMERLNAILMTAFTSALGLAPLAFFGGSGKEILQPLSIVVLGGMFTSTALTLLIIPAMYSRFGKWLFPKKATVADGENNDSPAAISRTMQRGGESELKPR
jgi:cation efflux system protein involved in nickel and cobalt tolerance